MYFGVLSFTLSTVLLAAHFYRAGQIALVLVCFAALPLVFLRKRPVIRAIQIFLVFGSLEWVRTAISLAIDRQALGLPWVRMALIIGGVALFSLFSALLLQTPDFERK